MVNGTEHKWKYANKEFEEDLGLNTIAYGWRDYDPAIARFNKLDRFAAKYDNLSPYHFTANNPILYMEIFGDSLDVANNRRSQKDIRNLVSRKNRKYLVFGDNGSVSLDFSKLKKGQSVNDLFSNDEGLNLVNDLVSASESYLYESSDVTEVNNESGISSIVEMWRDNNGVINASENGLDSNGKLTIRPSKGYDGQVVVAPRTTQSEMNSSGNQVNKSRSSIIFHELSENYERTTNNTNYHGTAGAHQKAINRENNWSGKSNTPGVATGVGNPKPSKGKRRKNYQKALNN